ncbi:DUF4254 domain-containing protein [Nocardia sp. NEAU-G5]|uniref:DUF4254 domain-containing protein n=1 Tax=Nocardia albiluteola TaxID=2842303 RepID=A0ABS6AY56_9NOCA|nr:DUF4254 domain-containing protein [Nocardia albiluteola]MBU3062813.1 DUF4254 domain-containing protein [Nocardia albiluteola]
MYVPQPGDPQSWAGGPGAALPDWHELLAAFCGHIGDEPDTHPVTGWARALAELHLARRDLPLRTAEIDSRRAELIVRIDDWVGRYIRGPHAQSLGSLVDGMAAAQVRAIALLRTADDAADERVHAAWFALAELADGWTDSTNEPDSAARRIGRFRAAGQ